MSASWDRLFRDQDGCCLAEKHAPPACFLARGGICLPWDTSYAAMVLHRGPSAVKGRMSVALRRLARLWRFSNLKR